MQSKHFLFGSQVKAAFESDVDYAPAFVVDAALVMLSVLSVWILCGHIRPLEAKAGKSYST